MSATYTTAHSNTRPLTHWERPGIEPASSWILVRFISSEPWRELQVCGFYLSVTDLWVFSSQLSFFFFPDLVDPHYTRLSINQSVHLGPLQASVLINYAFVMRRTASFASIDSSDSWRAILHGLWETVNKKPSSLISTSRMSLWDFSQNPGAPESYFRQNCVLERK